MKRIIKSRIFAFIIGAIVFGSIGVYASSYLAKDISFTPKNTNWKKEDGTDITNVKDAIDDLYKKNNQVLSYGNIKRYAQEDANNNNSIYTAEKDVTILANCIVVCDPEDSRAYSSLSMSSDGDKILLEDYSHPNNKMLKGKLGIYKLEKGQYVSCQSSAYYWGRFENRFIELNY